MGMPEAPRDVREQARRALGRQAPLPGEHGGQGLAALHQLHDDGPALPRAGEVVHGHDVRVIQPRHGLGAVAVTVAVAFSPAAGFAEREGLGPKGSNSLLNWHNWTTCR